MKKKNIFFIIAMLLFATLSCGFKVNAESDVIFSPKIRCWEKNGSFCYLDTTVNIDFDKVDVLEIESITFEILDNGQLLGSAISKGENLEHLLKYCSTFWGQTPSTYTSVTGQRTLTCKFRELQTTHDNGYWIRSPLSANQEVLPSTVRVTLTTNSQTYVVQN